MKVKTVGIMAAAGMMLASMSVWSLTKPGPRTATSGDGDSVFEVPSSTVLAATSAAVFRDGRTLLLEGRLGHAKLRATEDNTTFVFANIRAGQELSGQTSSALNLAIVIDRSGSMKGQRLQNALTAARGMVQRLRSGDVLSIVTYNAQAEVVLPATTLDEQSRGRALAALAGIRAQGDTCISCGIDTAAVLLRGRSGMVNRMLLLSDGEATTGVQDLDGFRRIGASLGEAGTAVSSIGVDVNYNERVMATLATESNGRHYFVESPSSLPRIFDAELESLVQSVARDTELTLELAPGVEVERVFDRPFRQEGRRLRVDMGAFSANEEKTLLVKVRIPRSAAGQRLVAELSLAYDDLTRAGAKGECRGRLSTLLGEEASDLDGLVLARLQRSETAAALTEVNSLFRNGRVEEAEHKVQEVRQRLERRQKSAKRVAPKGRASELSADFEAQAAALDQAREGLASAPSGPAAAAPAPARKAKAQVRRNQENATNFGF